MNYKDFYSELFEARQDFSSERKVDSFPDLPDGMPYGFFVYPDAKFGVVYNWGGHSEVAGGARSTDEYLYAGAIRMAISDDGSGDGYMAEYLPNKTSPKAIKTAKDLANFYGKKIHFERATWLREGRTYDTFRSLPDDAPYGFVVWPTGEFAVVDDWGGHEYVVGKKGDMNSIMKKGGIRIAINMHGDDRYIAGYLPTKATTRAKKTTKDLAAYYQIKIEWESAAVWLREEGTTDTFRSLPGDAPYGFVVWPTGEFGVVERYGEHETVSGVERYGEHETVSGDGAQGMKSIIKNGGVRVAKIKYDDGEITYQAEYLPTKTTQRAKKTTKDLAAHYQIELQWESAANWVRIEEAGANIAEEYPENWSKEEFEAIDSFNGRLKYANTHLAKIASGSGRAVFKIDDQKALKVAKNRKGLAQNKIESDWSMGQYEITAETFDIGEDVQGVGPFFVEMELAKKLTRSRFKVLTGLKLDDVEWYLRETAWNEAAARKYGRSGRLSLPQALQDEMHNNEFFTDLMTLIRDYDMGMGDPGRLSSYGEVVRDGQPKVVLVDFGLTTQVHDDFYKVN